MHLEILVYLFFALIILFIMIIFLPALFIYYMLNIPKDEKQTVADKEKDISSAPQI